MSLSMTIQIIFNPNVSESNKKILYELQCKKIYLNIQWNPREVNTLEVNSRLKSTPDGGPDFFLLCLSNFISLKVKDIGPILG